MDSRLAAASGELLLEEFLVAGASARLEWARRLRRTMEQLAESCEEPRRTCAVSLQRPGDAALHRHRQRLKPIPERLLRSSSVRSPHS